MSVDLMARKRLALEQQQPAVIAVEKPRAMVCAA